MKNKTNKKAYKNGFQDGWMELIGIEKEKEYCELS